MKDSKTGGARRVNRNRPNAQSPEYQVYPNLPVCCELRSRCTANESVQNGRNKACDRIKINLIYFLLILIVVLVGILCYTLVILFEEKYDVLQPIIDDVPVVNLSNEQRTWYDNGIQELRDSMKFKKNKQKAKNVILFVGDGMGLSTMTASRIYKYGEEGRLSWETFEHFGLLKVSSHSKCNFKVDNVLII